MAWTKLFGFLFHNVSELLNYAGIQAFGCCPTMFHWFLNHMQDAVQPKSDIERSEIFASSLRGQIYSTLTAVQYILQRFLYRIRHLIIRHPGILEFPCLIKRWANEQKCQGPWKKSVLYALVSSSRKVTWSASNLKVQNMQNLSLLFCV